MHWDEHWRSFDLHSYNDQRSRYFTLYHFSLYLPRLEWRAFKCWLPKI